MLNEPMRTLTPTPPGPASRFRPALTRRKALQANILSALRSKHRHGFSAAAEIVARLGFRDAVSLLPPSLVR